MSDERLPKLCIVCGDLCADDGRSELCEECREVAEAPFTPHPAKVPYGVCATGKHPIGSQPARCDECEIARNAAV